MIFVDAGPLVGLHLETSYWHAQALEGFARLEKTRERVVTTSLVLSEAVSVLARKSKRYDWAARVARDHFFGSAVLEVVRPSPPDEAEGLDLMERYAPSAVSFVDCVSFVVARTRKIATAFSFDEEHFSRKGPGGFDLFYYPGQKSRG